MVLLKEISEGIWGLTVGPNKVSEVVTDHPFRLTMAALEIDDAITVQDGDKTTNSITRVTIKSSTADNGPPTDLILCNLNYPSCLQQPLDIEFYDGQTLTFGTKGPHKVHLTGYVLQPEPQEMCQEGHLPVGKGHEFMEAEADSSSDDDDSDDDDSDDDDDDDDSDNVEDFHLAHRHHRLRDDEDQNLEDDYEDGYLEGEDELSSDTSSDSDDEEESEVQTETNKGKKRPHAEANGHSKKQEPEKKKLKNNKKNKEEPAAAAATHDTNESKKAKKAKPAETTTNASSNDKQSTNTTVDEKKKSNSLQINDSKVGNGPEAKFGKTAAVYYTGRLQSNNVVFDSCTKGKPFRFRLGAGEVIRGWDQGVKGMHVGGKRRLVIPPALAYGNKKLPDIPANSTLIFDIELKNVF